MKKLILLMFVAMILTHVTQDTSESKPNNEKPNAKLHFKKISEQITTHDNKNIVFISLSCIHCMESNYWLNKNIQSDSLNLKKIHIVTSQEISKIRSLYTQAISKDKNYKNLLSLMYKETKEGGLTKPSEFINLIRTHAESPRKILDYSMSKEIKQDIQKNTELQHKAKIPGTPYFIINGDLTPNLRNLNGWGDAIEKMININKK